MHNFPSQAIAPIGANKAMSSKKRLRQAVESDGGVAILCFACRRSSDGTKQQGLSTFFKAPDSSKPGASSVALDAPLQCSRCLRVMEQPTVDRGSGAASKPRVLPQIARIRSYQRVASEQGVPYTITDTAAGAMMRLPCVCCGVAAPQEGHGLTRLRVWPDGLARPARGGFMGPFQPENLSPACATCNLMKGARRVRSFVEACRHITTKSSSDDFGTYPKRFRDNTSKRSRSCYITASSTHTKTHALSNEAFNAIVSKPCYYCAKPSDPPRHHNGLDRLDSSMRVYTEESCVSCCGDCNVMKYTHSEHVFLSHVRAVAVHNVGVTTWPGDVEGEEETDEVAPGEEQVAVRENGAADVLGDGNDEVSTTPVGGVTASTALNATASAAAEDGDGNATSTGINAGDADGDGADGRDADGRDIEVNPFAAFAFA